MFDSTMLCVMSTRGFPLGEHLVVGSDLTNPEMCCLHNEATQVPLIVRMPNLDGSMRFRSARVNTLTSPDVISTVIENWFSKPELASDFLFNLLCQFSEPKAEVVFSKNEFSTAIQTCAWKLVLNGNEERLYAKPDDLWEANDVSRRCPDIVEQLKELVQKWTDNPRFHLQEEFQLADELATRD